MNFDIIWRDNFYIKSYSKINDIRFVIREYLSKCIIFSIYLNTEKNYIYTFPIYGNYKQDYIIKEKQLIFEVYEKDNLIINKIINNKMKKLPIEYLKSRDIIKNNFFLFKKDGGLSECIRNNMIWEKHIYDIIYELDIDLKNTNIIDIGANLGAHTLIFAEMVDEFGKVYAFEPQRIVYYQLCANIISNGFNNIYAFNVALSDDNGVTNIERVNYFDDNIMNIGNTHIVDSDGDKIEKRTLDSYFFENVSIIKIDVQGYENFVLNGALETIKKNNPIFIIEIEDEQLEIYNKNKNDIFDFFKKHKYILNHVYLHDYIAIPINNNLNLFDVYTDEESKIILISKIDIKNLDIVIKDINNNIIYYNKLYNLNKNIKYWFIPDNKNYLNYFTFEIYKDETLLFIKK